MSMFAIQEGPFAGTSFTFQEAVQSLVGIDLIEKAAIMMSALNQAFLKHYDPKAGWAVVIEGAMVGIDMSPLPSESAIGQPVPCAKFDAKLISPEGRTLATASTLWTICGPTSWEKGETNARLRLYEASGLQTRFDLPEGANLAKPVSQGLGKGAKPAATPVVGSKKEGTILSFRPFTESTEKETPAQDATAAVHVDVTPAVEAVEVAASAPAVQADVVHVADVVAEEAAETIAKVEVEVVAPAEKVVVPTKTEAQAKGRRGQTKKRELDRDAPISPELLERCTTMARMKFKKVPEMSTTGEALDFLTNLVA